MPNGNSGLFVEERQEHIREYIERAKRVSVNELIQYCKVSPSTIRNDLATLEKKGQIHRTHGGAMSVNRMLLQSTDAHGLRLNIREIDLREMLEASAQPDRWNRQTDKQVDIQVDFRPENPVITGDDHFLFAVFQNFIDNAFKYSGKQVKIQITCTEPDTRHLQVRICCGSQRTRIL